MGLRPTALPIARLAAMNEPGLLQKYARRALLITTGACAVHCRYCFRRHYPYQEASAFAEQLPQVLNTLRGTPEIDELILSGGDPFSLSNRRLSELLRAITELPQLKRVRLHSRTPVVLPERIDADTLAILSSCPLPLVLVIHANHPNELDGRTACAFEALRQQGLTLLNQSVLLQGVNDQAETLALLSEKLFSSGVLPYYLHALDKVSGAAHFEVCESVATQLISELRSRLPGYLVPRLVREVEGDEYKRPLV